MPTSSEMRGLRIVASRVVSLLSSDWLCLPDSYTPQDRDRVKDIAHMFAIRYSTNKLLTYEQLKVLDRAYTAHLDIKAKEENRDRENVRIRVISPHLSRDEWKKKYK